MEVLFSGSVVAPKVALLKANTVGRLQGVAAWKEELIRVADVYGTLAEGKHAQSLLSQIESSQNLTEKGPVFKNYKWIFPFDKSEKTQLILFNEALKKSLKQSRQKWQVSVDPYDHKTTFVVVHGIFDPVEIETWLEETTEQTQELRQRNNFVALSATYRDYQKNKTWIK